MTIYNGISSINSLNNVLYVVVRPTVADPGFFNCGWGVDPEWREYKRNVIPKTASKRTDLLPNGEDCTPALLSPGSTNGLQRTSWERLSMLLVLESIQYYKTHFSQIVNHPKGHYPTQNSAGKFQAQREFCTKTTLSQEKRVKTRCKKRIKRTVFVMFHITLQCNANTIKQIGYV